MIATRYGALDSADALETALREIGAERYHILHPFHRLLHTGKLSRGQVQAKMQQVEQLQREIAQLNDKMCYHADKAAEAIIKLHERT